MAEEKNSKQRHHRSMLLDSMYPVVALMLVLVACVELCDAATVVDVYRLIQYDISGVPFGSRFSSLNHHAASLSFQHGADLSRSVLILPLRELDIAFVQDYISQKQSLGGLLILLPQTFRPGYIGGGETQDGLRVLLAQLEKLLLHSNIPFPVYFAFENEETDAMLADVKKNDALGQQATATTGGYKLVISVSEPRKIASPTITNIQGWLPGSRADGDSNQLPTIAVVASYDTFGAAPALSVGSDSNGSGVVALLEVARLFSTLYSNPKTRGRYNLLFALTSGGPYNYEGTQKWLKSLDQRMRESIDYAICLNSVGSWDNELLVHVSKPPENAYIKQIFEGFSNVAEDLGFQVSLKHKKINISNSRVAWEHEQFSRLRVTAATVSELLTPPELLESAGSLSDTRQHVNEDSIIKGVKLVAESLARHIYGHQGKDIQIFADNSSLAVNRFYVKSWLDSLSQTPRVAPFLSKNEPLIMALKKELEDYTAEVSIQQESLDGIFTFYDSTKASLNIYQVASVTFDLLLLLVLGSYLIMLFSFLVITTRGLDDLISIFRRPPSRKIKIA
ncbi:nicalin-1 [Brassica rapa]|uniref:Nicalin n=1 Tax=Brassica campestris TaxID=3711 RepID=M4F1R1_BRACM|nr:nicalin-1 [Brassica rapa]